MGRLTPFPVFAGREDITGVYTELGVLVQFI